MFYSDALNLYKKLKLKLQTTSMNYNIGGILRKKGSFDSALEYFNQALHSYQELGNPQTIAAVFNVIGKTYHQKSDLEQAKIHLQAALQLRESVKNNLSISRTLYLLILVCIDKGELDLAENYLNELLIIDKKESNKTIAIRALTANAIFLKTKKRTTHRAKAEEILKNIVSSEVSDHEVTIDALINLIELLISELHLTNDINVLNELKDYIQKLLEIAKKQHSLLIFADMYWLQSQIALIELDILRAKAFLSQALITSEEIGYKQLAMKISFEYDKLLDELYSWESVIGKEIPISERMDKLKLEEFFVNNILKRKFDGLQLPNEEPVMLIFTSSVGKPIFTKKFHIGKELMDDSLISGFLMAFNSFMNQTFESKGLFDRIKHKEYTIIIQNIDSIIICYIFKGQSFTALQKVIQLINKLQQDEKLFNILENCIDSSKPLSNILVNSLEKIIDPIFV